MTVRSKDRINEIRQNIFARLKEEKAFWSYPSMSFSVDMLDDDQLIALTLRYLDLAEIKQLFNIFSYNKIKKAWKRHLVPEGEYLYTLNRFIAWYYFKAKQPDAYLKNIQTRQLNQILLTLP